MIGKFNLFASGKRSSVGKKVVLGSVIPILIVSVWQYLSSNGIVDAILFPAPSTILNSFYEMIVSGELIDHLKISVVRAMLGFLLGGSLGLLAGLVVGMFVRAEELLDPTMQMLRTIPLLALTPLFILWFGLGETSKVLLIAFGAFFPLYVNAFLGVRNVDAKLFDVAKVLEFNRFRQITRLVLPAAMPNVLLGLRLSLSVSWLLLVVAELMGASRGVGFLIQDARTFVRTDVVFIGIFLFAAAGKLTDSLVRMLEHWLLKWQDSYKG
ncbi:ABC transporter permease [Cohnella faecalis]|uniref:ABC transporter permease n=1 Tax=Cohnella faecalis TaxID=2315694 RepID=A0A398CCI9_9BACL|nr:ABC transporter permease [Cohnella faecalis]RIE00440.1 ABC transporter permease [Cohnella faecalis]